LTPRKRQNSFVEIEHSKFEGHVMPNKEEYQKSGLNLDIVLEY